MHREARPFFRVDQRAGVVTADEEYQTFAVVGQGGEYGISEAARRRMVAFANLVDVFVLPEYRGRGFSKRLMDAVMAHPDLQGLRRFTLATWDAHGLYACYGFQTPSRPETLMEKYVPDIYAVTA